MTQTGVIIQRRADSSIPDDYTSLALTENPTAWGAAIPTPDGLEINSGDGMDLETFNNTLAEFPDRDIYWYLCNSESAINMDDVPPYNIIENEKEEPELILLITGEYPGYKKPDSTHPTAYHYVHEFIIPELQSMYELAEGDIVKVLTQIDKPIFRKKMLSGAIGSVAMTFVTANGKACTIVQGDGHNEYKWGWVSSNYGYALAPPEPEKKEDPPPKKSAFPKKSTVREPAPSAQPPKGVDVTPPVKAGATSVGNGSIGVRKVKPRADSSKQDRKTFYKRYIGYCPEGWENPKGVEIEVYFDKNTNLLMTLSDIKNLKMDAVAVPILNNPPRAGGKDTAPDHINGGENNKEKAVTTESLPLLGPNSRDFLAKRMKRDDIQKLMSEDGKEVTDPARIAEQEKKMTGFSDQMGEKDSLYLNAKLCALSWDEQQKWGTQDKKSYDVFVRSLINYYLSVETAKRSKLSTQEVHVAAKEELKPEARKSAFPQKKRATG